MNKTKQTEAAAPEVRLDALVGRVLSDYADEWATMPMGRRRFLAQQEADWRSQRLAYARAEVDRLEAAVGEANELVEAIAANDGLSGPSERSS